LGGFWSAYFIFTLKAGAAGAEEVPEEQPAKTRLAIITSTREMNKILCFIFYHSLF
jgi:hypothetical protein